MTLQNEKFEELLSRQLTAELEPQRGKAAAAFQAQLAAEKAEREAERAARAVAGGSKKREAWARQEVSGRAMWFWAGVPSLVAAGLAIVVTLHLVNRPTVETPVLIVQPQPEPVMYARGGSGGGGGGNPGDVHLVTTPYEIQRKPDEAPLTLPPIQLASPYRLPQ